MPMMAITTRSSVTVNPVRAVVRRDMAFPFAVKARLSARAAKVVRMRKARKNSPRLRATLKTSLCCPRCNGPNSVAAWIIQRGQAGGK
jgi:hypothetical protein